MEERIQELEAMLERARLTTIALCFLSRNHWDYNDLLPDFDFVEFGRKVELEQKYGPPPEVLAAIARGKASMNRTSKPSRAQVA